MDLDLQRDMYYYAFYSVLDSQSYVLALEGIEKSRVRLHKLQEEREMEEREITEWDKKIKRWWSKLSGRRKNLLKWAFVIGWLLVALGAPSAIHVGAMFIAIGLLLGLYLFMAMIGIMGYFVLVFAKKSAWWFLGLINIKEDRGNISEFAGRLAVGIFMSVVACTFIYVFDQWLPKQAQIDAYQLVTLALIFALAIDRKTPRLGISGQKQRNNVES